MDTIKLQMFLPSVDNLVRACWILCLREMETLFVLQISSFMFTVDFF